MGWLKTRPPRSRAGRSSASPFLHRPAHVPFASPSPPSSSSSFSSRATHPGLGGFPPFVDLQPLCADTFCARTFPGPSRLHTTYEPSHRQRHARPFLLLLLFPSHPSPAALPHSPLPPRQLVCQYGVHVPWSHRGSRRARRNGEGRIRCGFDVASNSQLIETIRSVWGADCRVEFFLLFPLFSLLLFINVQRRSSTSTSPVSGLGPEAAAATRPLRLLLRSSLPFSMRTSVSATSPVC